MCTLTVLLFVLKTILTRAGRTNIYGANASEEGGTIGLSDWVNILFVLLCGNISVQIV